MKRIADLKAAVGCSYASIYDWAHSEAPPARMQKGFDARLIAALKTDRRTLFLSYASIAPEAAPVIDPPRRRPRGGNGIARAPMARAA
jgi:hypothetical protein